MSVTFSGAFTFTGGGFTASLAPPAGATAGWFGGGQTGPSVATIVSTVDRITFATDTATASVRGSLSNDKNRTAATGTLTYGYFGGGYVSGTFFAGFDRITFASDTATATQRGALNNDLADMSATTDSTTYGWFGGGFNPNLSPNTVSSVQRITYANDSVVASLRGPLTSIRSKLAATGSSSYGWFGGGYNPPTSAGTSIVNRITYATDTDTASTRGSLSSARYNLTAVTDTTTYGWFAGGLGATVVQRITYATDTATASVRGPLSSARSTSGATCNSTYGWIGGGSPITSTITRITYATDTDTSVDRGYLSIARQRVAGTSGQQ